MSYNENFKKINLIIIKKKKILLKIIKKYIMNYFYLNKNNLKVY